MKFPARRNNEGDVNVIYEKIVHHKQSEGEQIAVLEELKHLFHESNFVKMLESFTRYSICFTQDGVILAAHEIFQRATGYRS